MSDLPGNVRCKGCGTENEFERVYCRTCGAKLDHTLVPETAHSNDTDPVKRVRRRLGRVGWGGWFSRGGGGGAPLEGWVLLRILLGAATSAFLLQAFRAPEYAEVSRTAAPTRLIGSDLVQAIGANGPRELVFTEAELNGYLSGLRTRMKAGPVPGVAFQRLFVHLEPEVARLEMQNDVLGWPLYMGLAYTVEAKDGRLQTRLTGGNLGRVSLPAWAGSVLRFGFEKVLQSMTREWELLGKAQSLRLEEGRAVILIKGR